MEDCKRRKTTMEMCEADFFLTSTVSEAKNSQLNSPRVIKTSFDKKIVINTASP